MQRRRARWGRVVGSCNCSFLEGRLPGTASRKDADMFTGPLSPRSQRLKDEQEKDRDPKTVYEDQMTEENQDIDE